MINIEALVGKRVKLTMISGDIVRGILQVAGHHNVQPNGIEGESLYTYQVKTLRDDLETWHDIQINTDYVITAESVV